MIIYHEGRPRSGKSYEACIKRIIPALKQGRKVFAYIEGLNHEKFAEVTGLLLDRVKELLIQITVDQVKTIYDHIENDSLVIIDEIQDFFPSDRSKLTPEITTFVTQHGHRGLDIVLMGQDYRDTHSLWKRRIDQLYQFTKQDAVGRPNKYTWTSYKFKGDKPIKLNSGTGEYQPKYFGLYASHTADTENKETYNDDRANVLKNSALRYGVGGAVLAAVLGVYYLYRVFTGEAAMVKTDHISQNHLEAVPVTTANPIPAPVVVNGEQIKPTKKVPGHVDYVDSILTQYKPRLAGVIEGKKKDGNKRVVAYVEFLDDTNHVKEVLSLQQLQDFGWMWGRRSYGFELKKGMQSVVVTAWPIDVYGKVPQETSRRLNSDEARRSG